MVCANAYTSASIVAESLSLWHIVDEDDSSDGDIQIVKYSPVFKIQNVENSLFGGNLADVAQPTITKFM